MPNQANAVRDMSDREFKAALDRHGFIRCLATNGSIYYRRGDLSVPVGAYWPKRQKLAHLIRRFDEHDEDRATKIAAAREREAIRNAYANGVTV